MAGQPDLSGAVDLAAQQPKKMSVAQIPPGSILHLQDVGMTADQLEQLVREVAKVAGHGQFVILTSHQGSIEVWGPGADWAEKVIALREMALGDALGT